MGGCGPGFLTVGYREEDRGTLLALSNKGGPKNAGTFRSRKSENHILPWSQKKVPSSGNTSTSVR